MKIGFSREKITGLFLEGRKNIISIVIIVFALIFIFIIYRNQNRKIGFLNSQKATETKKNEVLSEIARSEKKINAYKNFFTKKDTASVTNAINNIARNSNVRLVSLSPGTEENLPSYIRQPYILTIEADGYHAIGKFISQIESQAEMYSVDAMSIKLREEKSAAPGELSEAAKPTNGLIVNVTLSKIVFKG